MVQLVPYKPCHMNTLYCLFQQLVDLSLNSCTCDGGNPVCPYVDAQMCLLVFTSLYSCAQTPTNGSSVIVGVVDTVESLGIVVASSNNTRSNLTYQSGNLSEFTHGMAL